MKRGYFVTFEGGEGGGKSTQLRRFGDALESNGIEIVRTREPGGEAGAEEIRKLLISGSMSRWTAKTELLLHYSARINHLESVILPALEDGKWVICDRFHDSTMAYQGYGHELGVDLVNGLHNLLLGKFKPDLTLIFDLPAKLGLKRAKDRGEGEDRYELMGPEFHERLRLGFLEIAKKDPRRCVVLDASKNEDAVYSDLITNINKRLGLGLE